MTRSGTIDSDVNPVLWAIGWYWLYVFIAGPVLGMAAIFALEGALGSLVLSLGFFGGPILGVAGLVYVRMNVGDVRESGSRDVMDSAAEVARLDGDNNETFSLVTNTGDSLPLLPHPNRRVATLVVGDALLLVHDSAVVNLPGLKWNVGDSTNEFYYDQISSVNYDPNKKSPGGTFQVNQSDGNHQSWDTVSDAKKALSSVQDRIRAYKTK